MDGSQGSAGLERSWNTGLCQVLNHVSFRLPAPLMRHGLRAFDPTNQRSIIIKACLICNWISPSAVFSSTRLRLSRVLLRRPDSTRLERLRSGRYRAPDNRRSYLQHGRNHVAASVLLLRYIGRLLIVVRFHVCCKAIASYIIHSYTTPYIVRSHHCTFLCPFRFHSTCSDNFR